MVPIDLELVRPGRRRASASRGTRRARPCRRLRASSIAARSASAVGSVRSILWNCVLRHGEGRLADVDGEDLVVAAVALEPLDQLGADEAVGAGDGDDPLLGIVGRARDQRLGLRDPLAIGQHGARSVVHESSWFNRDKITGRDGYQGGPTRLPVDGSQAPRGCPSPRVTRPSRDDQRELPVCSRRAEPLLLAEGDQLLDERRVRSTSAKPLAAGTA